MRTVICRVSRLRPWKLVSVSPDGLIATYRHCRTGEVVMLAGGSR